MTHDDALALKIPRDSATLRQQVTNRLRLAITEGRFRPGDRLTERELCELLGVSRPLVREALRQLEAEELVTSIPYRGPVVSDISIAQARKLYLVRSALEGMACRLFALHGSAAARTALRQSLDRFAVALGTGDRATIVAAKNAFYACLLAGAGNEILESHARQLQARVSYLWSSSLSHPGRVAQSIREMDGMVSAIERGDADAAEQACRVYLSHAVEVAEQTIQELAQRKAGTLAA
jgi:DNA-binding GntR family transcriptional regulator